MISPLTTIILVNWNTLEDTLACLDSLSHLTYSNWNTVVVDNGSENEEAQRIKILYPDVIVLETGENLGFTGGNNRGIEHALSHGAEFILCLNNDTTVAPDFLSLLVSAMVSDPKIGIATSTIFYHGEPERVAALGCWVYLDRSPTVGHILSPAQLDNSLEKVIDVPFAEGCVLMMSREVAEKTGGFNDQFFAYLEDADLGLKTHKLGCRIVLVPAAHVWHKIGSKEGGQGSPRAIYYCMRNSWHLVNAHASVTERKMFRSSMLRHLIKQWSAFLESSIVLNGLRKHYPHRHRELVAHTTGLLSGISGRTGRQKDHGVDKIMQTTITLLAWLADAGGKLLHPLYRLRKRLK